ncbi:hypothetical protein ACX1NX_11245 [Acinetobacter sp. ANC 5383]
MKIKPLNFSIIIGLIISVVFIFLTIVTLYYYSWSLNSSKEILSAIGSYFGAVATLGAAIIASYLFNDWRLQFNAENHASFSKDILGIYRSFDDQVVKLTDSINSISNILSELHNRSGNDRNISIKPQIEDFIQEFENFYKSFEIIKREMHIYAKNFREHDAIENNIAHVIDIFSCISEEKSKTLKYLDSNQEVAFIHATNMFAKAIEINYFIRKNIIENILDNIKV